jgi:hypothetical protein
MLAAQILTVTSILNFGNVTKRYRALFFIAKEMHPKARGRVQVDHYTEIFTLTGRLVDLTDLLTGPSR